MGAGLSCMKRSEGNMGAPQADGGAMPFQHCKGVMEGHVKGKAREVEAMATEKNASTYK